MKKTNIREELDKLIERSREVERIIKEWSKLPIVDVTTAKFDYLKKECHTDWKKQPTTNRGTGDGEGKE